MGCLSGVAALGVGGGGKWHLGPRLESRDERLGVENSLFPGDFLLANMSSFGRSRFLDSGGRGCRKGEGQLRSD